MRSIPMAGWMGKMDKVFASETMQWFDREIGTPTPVQQEGWPAIASGGHVLISAPTGTGKTLAAFLVLIDRLMQQVEREALPDELQLIYISPLKSLGNDIRENLRRPLDGLGADAIRVAIRTGDTPSSERQRMLKRPPHILITTPESLYLLLTSKSGKKLLSSAKTVIIDELHAMIANKRGAHLMLSLGRLDILCQRRLQRIGLSATIEPLEQAAAYLAAPDPVAIIAPPMKKDMDIQVNSPLPDMRILTEGTIWPDIAKAVYAHCQHARTVIAFVESRMQAERLAYHVNRIGGENFARTHHGCVSKEQRLEAEMHLRSGQLRLLCATSSMELGIDVGQVDLVVQIGFPMSISSTMQRLGRAGHNPGRTSVMHLFPRTAAEGVYCGLTATAALLGKIEPAYPPRGCLDILAQHLVSMADEEGYSVEDVLPILERTYSFADVTREQICSVLEMLSGDYEHEQDKPARARVLYDRIHHYVRGDAYSRMLALSAGGTIPDKGWFPAMLADGTRLGELDEEYIFEARVGDKLLLGAFAWRIQEIRQDRVIVAPASMEGAQSPFWKGDYSGRAYPTGVEFGRQLRGLNEAYHAKRLRRALMDMHLDAAAADNAADYIARQIEAAGCLADDQTLVVEHFNDQAGDEQIMVHSIFGRRVNAGLALLAQHKAHEITGMDITSFDDDEGFLLYPYGLQTMPDGLLGRIDPDSAPALLEAMIIKTALFNITFRYNANRALMMGVRKARRVPLWVQRLRAAEVMGVAIEHQDHPLVIETKRECLEDHWNVPAIVSVLEGIQSGRIAVREVHLDEPSPMSLPLRRQAESNLLYEYHPTPSNVQRVMDQTLAAQEALAPSPEQLEAVSQPIRRPADAQQLHAFLLEQGDMLAGEIDAPVQWLEALTLQERVLYVEPGLWICAEHAGQYQDTLENGDIKAQKRILRRCLRYRGAQDAESLSDRYRWPAELSQALLDELVEEQAAVKSDTLYFHVQLYERAQHQTVAQRRKQVQTLPPERYAAMISQRIICPGSPAEQLEQGMEALVNQGFAPKLWESVLLPARTSGYRPAMLDRLLSKGEFLWRMSPGEKPLLHFHRYADIDWDAYVTWDENGLNEQENKLMRILQSRGASFPQALAPALEGRSPLDALLSLAAKGLIYADSFIPVRQWLDSELVHQQVKRRARARTAAQMAGRWDLCRPLRSQSVDEQIGRAFDRAVLLCRETAQGLPWSQALDALRIWEYTGKARRGYFIQGLSGAQFIRQDGYQQALLEMGQPRTQIIWLHAVDPAQPWGRSLPHAPGRAFQCIPGTTVALRSGMPVAVLERQGEQLRVLDEEHIGEALQALVHHLEQKRIYTDLHRLVIKQYPASTVPALEKAGFVRHMLDYVYWKRPMQ